MMQYICDKMDRHDRYGYVLASPAGVRLYSKFGFEVVGRVDTPEGPITSMLRRQRSSLLVCVPTAVDQQRDGLESGRDVKERGDWGA